MRKVKGHKLTTKDQEAVLAAHMHDLREPLQFSCPIDWLCNTTFLVRNDGHLDNRFYHCESKPTYPNNPEYWKVVQ